MSYLQEMEQGTSWKTAPRADLLAKYSDVGKAFVAQVSIACIFVCGHVHILLCFLC